MLASKIIIPFQKGVTNKTKTYMYLGIILCTFLIGKMYGSQIAFSPYTLFLGVFVSYFGWTKTLGIHATLFVINELQVAPTIISVLGYFWLPLYISYFFFTFSQSFLINKALHRWTPLFRMINI